ncbi:MAG TPA: hemerythrin domain-containing protein [Acidimicrobiales bacterium]|nr:hemerythrin domain-containing protein [Acidimicrobiales bacterium]
MDAVKLLTADHNRVRGLFTRFETAKEGDDLGEMSMLAGMIATELQVHTTIEEEIFYPWAQDLNEEIHEIITEGYEEHNVAKQLLAEITSMTPNTEDWAAKVTVLMENVEHHAEEEETDLFPKLRGASSADELAALAERLEARKEELGAPTMADKIDLTKEELMELAREQEIPGRSSMDQEELAATVAPPMA